MLTHTSYYNITPSYLCELYYRFIGRFPIGFDFLLITFFPHLFLAWTSSLSISSSAISASTLSNHVLDRPTGSSAFNFILHTFLHSPLMTVVLVSTPTNVFHLFTCPSVFHGNTTHPSNHLHLCSFKNFNPTSAVKGMVSLP